MGDTPCHTAVCTATREQRNASQTACIVRTVVGKAVGPVIEDSGLLCQKEGKSMTITKELNGNEAVLKVDGRLDTKTSPELLSAIEGLGDTVTSLLLDCAGLEFISSAGLRVVIIAYKKMKGALVIKNASERIMSIFKITGIAQQIKVE